MFALTAAGTCSRTVFRLLPIAVAAACAGAAESRWAGAPAAQVLVGYTDNALLSSIAPQASWFSETKIDSLWRHEPGERWQASGYVETTWRHYAAADLGVRDQGGWHARGELRWSPLGRVALSGIASGFGETSIVDFSETTDQRLIAVARLRGGALGTVARLEFHRTLTFQASARASRVDYRTFSGDHSARERAARLEWRPLARLTLSAGWRVTGRIYSDRTRYTAGGRALAGTRLNLGQSTADLDLQLALDAHGATRLGLRGSRGETRDGASGYFDYRLTRATVRLEHRRGAWHWLAEFGHHEQIHRVQTGGTGIAPPRRQAQRRQFEVQAERRLASGWSWLGAFTRERERGNLAEFDYSAAVATSGFRVTF